MRVALDSIEPRVWSNGRHSSSIGECALFRGVDSEELVRLVEVEGEVDELGREGEGHFGSPVGKIGGALKGGVGGGGEGELEV